MDTERLIKSGIRVVMCLTGIIGNNWLLIGSLPKSTAQLRTSDVLFINLAVSNLITNYLVDILDVLHIERYIPVGKLYCSIQFFLPELSETSSILTTMYITVYWHQKLVGSLKRGGAPVRMDNFHVITAMLMGSWTFSLAMNVAHLFFVAEIGENMTAVECEEKLPSPEADQAYKVIYITLANVLPLSGITYASIQIARTLMENEKRMKNMGAEAKSGGNGAAEKSGDATNVSTVTKSKSQAKTGSLVRAAKSVVAVAVLFLICWVIHLIVIIISSIATSSLIEDMESFVGATYTCTIPYIYLYGVQKLNCSRRAGRVIGHERTATH